MFLNRRKAGVAGLILQRPKAQLLLHHDGGFSLKRDIFPAKVA